MGKWALVGPAWQGAAWQGAAWEVPAWQSAAWAVHAPLGYNQLFENLIVPALTSPHCKKNNLTSL